MARATFDELKQEVITRAEETGMLPSSIRVGGVQYAIEMPTEARVRLLQVVKNPVRLDAALDMVTFVGADGSTVHA